MTGPAEIQPKIPTLSIVTPALNSMRFIEETLDSVAALTTPHEHIVIDGGSTDGTVEMLEARRDPNVSWVSEEDRGQTHAVNKGIARAKGELVAWLNADDAYVPGNVDAAVRRLTADPGADAIFGFMDIINAEGEFQRRYKCGPWHFRRYLFAGEYVPTPTIIFRRSLLAKMPELNERFKDAADYDFYLRLLRDAKVLREREPLVRFRYHEDSKTGGNVELQKSEAMDIRLAFARGPLDRAAMRAVGQARRVREKLIRSWPEADA